MLLSQYTASATGNC